MKLFLRALTWPVPIFAVFQKGTLPEGERLKSFENSLSTYHEGSCEGSQANLKDVGHLNPQMRRDYTAEFKRNPEDWKPSSCPTEAGHRGWEKEGVRKRPRLSTAALKELDQFACVLKEIDEFCGSGKVDPATSNGNSIARFSEDHAKEDVDHRLQNNKISSSPSSSIHSNQGIVPHGSGLMYGAQQPPNNQRGACENLDAIAQAQANGVIIQQSRGDEKRRKTNDFIPPHNFDQVPKKTIGSETSGIENSLQSSKDSRGILIMTDKREMEVDSENKGPQSSWESREGLCHLSIELGKELIEKNTEISTQMSLFWEEIASKMTGKIKAIFPKFQQEQSITGCGWKAENIVFPMFIHRVQWITEKFDSPEEPFSFSSSIEYFQGWLKRTIEYYPEAFRENVVSGRITELISKKMSFSFEGPSDLILFLEYGTSLINFSSIAWKIVQEWHDAQTSRCHEIAAEIPPKLRIGGLYPAKPYKTYVKELSSGKVPESRKQKKIWVKYGWPYRNNYRRKLGDWIEAEHQTDQDRSPSR